MSKLKCTFSVVIASLCFFVSSSEQTAVAQKSVSSGKPAYYGSQTVYRSHRGLSPRVYSHPNKQSTRPFLQAHPDAVVAAPNQKRDSNPSSNGNGTNIRSRNGKQFGDNRDVFGMTNRKR